MSDKPKSSQGAPPSQTAQGMFGCLTTWGIICVICYAFYTSYFSTSARIYAVLAADHHLKKEVASQSGIYEKYWDASGNALRYVGGMRAIDLSHCPPDFQVAYLRHVHAWDSAQQEMAHNQGLSGVIKGFFGGIVGPVAGYDVYNTASKEHEGAIRAITESWNDVELIALKYGVSLRKVR